MTRYTVVWRPDTEAELASLWCKAPDRQALSSAANRIDDELRIDARAKGIAIPDGLMSLTVEPLTAYYFVDEGDRKAFVVGVEATWADS